MEDLHNLGQQKYNCADEIEPLSASKQFLLTLKILTTIVPSLCTAVAWAACSVLKSVYHLVFPKPLNSIRGQLAVVNIRDAANAVHRLTFLCSRCCGSDHESGIEISIRIEFAFLYLKVTGGGNGIGREICLQLAMEGCNVAVLDVDASGAERTCDDIRRLGVTAMPYKVGWLLNTGEGQKPSLFHFFFFSYCFYFAIRSMLVTTVKWSL